MNEKENFIAIEGGDGSGKGTQAELLRKYLTQELGKYVVKISFPQHGEFSSYYTDKYLNGAYGSADEVPADLASLTYALDRFAAKGTMMECLDRQDGFLIADRYVASNLAHQGTKFSDPVERKQYYDNMMRTEYEVFGIPRPSKNIVLIVPTDIAQENVDKKEIRGYTDMKRDIHESNVSHLERAKANYEELCQLYPEEFIPIQCTDSERRMRSIEEIQQEIRCILGV